RFHQERQADLTVGCILAPLHQCMQFGVMEIDKEDRVTGFVEKPPQTQSLPDDPGHFLASMGIYVFSSRLMYEVLVQDATRADSHHDFGTDIIPVMMKSKRVFAFRFRDKNQKKVPYWRDVG